MDKEKLLGGHRVDVTEDVEIPGVGVVRVRGLSRMEMLLAGKLGEPQAMEPRVLSYAMVDPEITEGEAQHWMRTSPAGEIKPVLAAINRLSGHAENSAKEAAKRATD